jgi:hypothetical protein
MWRMCLLSGDMFNAGIDRWYDTRVAHPIRQVKPALISSNPWSIHTTVEAQWKEVRIAFWWGIDRTIDILARYEVIFSLTMLFKALTKVVEIDRRAAATVSREM